MKTRSLTLVALIVAAASPVFAQNYQPRCPQPQPVDPGPVTSGYFLGVYTSTVPVSGPVGGQPGGGPVAMVVPGYGETVYGQRIDQIVPNSPAYHAGLEPGDIIVSANGRAMDSKQDLIAAIQSSQGYLEMQVQDINTGQLQWVVAETGAPGQGPVLTSRNQSNDSPRVNPPSYNLGRNRNLRQTAEQFTDQVRSTVEQFGGRRPPVGRRR